MLGWWQAHICGESAQHNATTYHQTSARDLNRRTHFTHISRWMRGVASDVCARWSIEARWLLQEVPPSHIWCVNVYGENMRNMFAGGFTLVLHSYIGIWQRNRMLCIYYICSYKPHASCKMRSRGLSESIELLFCEFKVFCGLAILRHVFVCAVDADRDRFGALAQWTTAPSKKAPPPQGTSDRCTKRKVLYIAARQPLRLVER